MAEEKGKITAAELAERINAFMQSIAPDIERLENPENFALTCCVSYEVNFAGEKALVTRNHTGGSTGLRAVALTGYLRESRKLAVIMSELMKGWDKSQIRQVSGFSDEILKMMTGDGKEGR